MGAYRLLLSILVLLSHFGIAFHGRNIGVVAVVSFFLLSGYVMTALIDKHYLAGGRIPAFFLDRAIRLFPQYLFYLAATTILIVAVHPTSDFLSNITALGVLANVTMLPMNFFLFFPNCLFIPQAWSLGLESQFYILIPLLLVFKARLVAFALSFAAFLIAYLGVVDTDTYGYRMISGTLFLFLFGSFLRRASSKHETWLAAGIYVLCVGLLLGSIFRPALDLHFNVEVLGGLLIGLPVVVVLSRMKFGRIEALLGNLSYGVFLNQFLLMWVFESLAIDTKRPLNLFGLIVASIALAWISYNLVERPAIALRHRLRSNVDAHRIADQAG